MEPIPTISNVLDNLRRDGLVTHTEWHCGIGGAFYSIYVNNRPLKWTRGPADVYNDMVIYKDKHGETHRGDDLPAIIGCDGSKYWYKHGKLHRADDKPAIVRPDGAVMFWLDGVQYTP